MSHLITVNKCLYALNSWSAFCCLQLRTLTYSSFSLGFFCLFVFTNFSHVCCHTRLLTHDSMPFLLCFSFLNIHCILPTLSRLVNSYYASKSGIEKLWVYVPGPSFTFIIFFSIEFTLFLSIPNSAVFQ